MRARRIRTTKQARRIRRGITNALADIALMLDFDMSLRTSQELVRLSMMGEPDKLTFDAYGVTLANWMEEGGVPSAQFFKGVTV